MAVNPNFFADLKARNLVQDSTDIDALSKRLAQGPIGLYCGFDPTASSLHVGNLIGLLLLRRFQDAGHKAYALAGGSTGMVGDPSGKSDERNLLDAETLDSNLTNIKKQLAKFLDFEGVNPAELVNNYDWTGHVTALEFMRDVGKHITVNQMMAKDSVKSRMESETGISYTEFSYMMLQAFDFYWLHENKECELQVGGSDQWGNITLGVDLIRRKSSEKAYAMTHPLMLKADGTKYGKTAGGETLWLDPELMSPYRFYQSWIQIDDSEVEKLLKWLTFIDVSEIDSIVGKHQEESHLRLAQKRLAYELTSIVHDKTSADASVEATAALFGGSVEGLNEVTFEMLSGEVPTIKVDRVKLDQEQNLVDLLTTAEVVSSNGEANRMLKQNGISVNDNKVTETDSVNKANLLHDRFVIIRKGKKSVHLLDFS